MAIIFNDTFNRANSSSLGTATTGQTWSVVGVQGISSNKAFMNGGFGGTGVNLTLTANYVVRTTFSNINSSETPTMVFWRQDGTVFVGVQAVPTGYQIVGFNFDEGHIVHATSTSTPTNGDIITVTVNYSTKVADVYLNGTAAGNKIITWTLTTKYPMASLTSVGISGSGTVSLFDDYYVADSISDLSGGGSSVTVNSFAVNATATANNPVVTAQKTVSISDVIANSTASALNPVVGATSNKNIVSVVANSVPSALLPVVSAVVNKSITSIVASSSASALPPALATGVIVNVQPLVVNSTASSLSPVIKTECNISPTIAGSNASANPPLIGSVTSISAVVAIVNGQSLPPAITAQKQVNASSVAANSNANAIAPIVTIIIPNVVVIGKAALANALAIIPSLAMNAVALVRIVNLTGTVSGAIELRGEVIIEPTRPPINLEGDATVKPAELRGEV